MGNQKPAAEKQTPSHKRLDTKTRQRIRSALRKIWQWSEPRKLAKARARVKRGVYQCEECGGFFGQKDVEVNHIHPVGAFPGSRNDDGSATWDQCLARLFCPADDLEVLCKKGCHAKKTRENR